MSPQARDRLLAILTLAFSATYFALARSIEDSLLADAVGAGGVPQGVGVMIGLAALALWAKSWVGQTQTDAPVATSAGVPPSGDRLSGTFRTVGMVALLLAYAAALPWLGYIVSIVLLLLLAAWLAGARLGAPMIGASLLGGPALWLLFDGLLQVRMPWGRLWGG